MIIHATTDPIGLREAPVLEQHPCVGEDDSNIVLKGDDSKNYIAEA